MKIIFFPELVKDDSNLRALLKQNNFACMSSFMKDEIRQDKNDNYDYGHQDDPG